MADAELAIGIHAINPEAYLLEHLKRGVRLDGREILQSRPIKCQNNYIPKHPSAFVSIGDTSIICAVKFLIGTPGILATDCGDILFDVTIAGPKSDSSRGKSPLELQIETTLHTIVEQCSLLDLRQLCIVEHKAAFRLCVYVTCLRDDGNVMDAACLGAIRTLSCLRIPKPIENSKGLYSITVDGIHSPLAA